MDNNTILHNYQDWLMHHQMPPGKKKTLLAAIELFSQQGYNGTSTAQIAEKAGISQATIFKGTSKNTSRASRASNLSLIYSLFLVNFCL